MPNDIKTYLDSLFNEWDVRDEIKNNKKSGFDPVARSRGQNYVPPTDFGGQNIKVADKPIDVSGLIRSNPNVQQSPQTQNIEQKSFLTNLFGGTQPTPMAGVQTTPPKKVDSLSFPSTKEAIQTPGRLGSEGFEELKKGEAVSGLMKIAEGLGHGVLAVATVPFGLLDDSLKQIGLPGVADALNNVFSLPVMGVQGVKGLIDSGLKGTEFSKEFNKGMEYYLSSKGIAPEEQEKIKGNLDRVTELTATLLAFKGAHKVTGAIKKGMGAEKKAPITIREDIKPPESKPPKVEKTKTKQVGDKIKLDRPEQTEQILEDFGKTKVTKESNKLVEPKQKTEEGYWETKEEWRKTGNKIQELEEAGKPVPSELRVKDKKLKVKLDELKNKLKEKPTPQENKAIAEKVLEIQGKAKTKNEIADAVKKLEEIKSEVRNTYKSDEGLVEHVQINIDYLRKRKKPTKQTETPKSEGLRETQIGKDTYYTDGEKIFDSQKNEIHPHYSLGRFGNLYDLADEMLLRGKPIKEIAKFWGRSEDFVKDYFKSEGKQQSKPTSPTIEGIKKEAKGGDKEKIEFVERTKKDFTGKLESGESVNAHWDFNKEVKTKLKKEDGKYNLYLTEDLAYGSSKKPPTKAEQSKPIKSFNSLDEAIKYSYDQNLKYRDKYESGLRKEAKTNKDLEGIVNKIDQARQNINDFGASFGVTSFKQLSPKEIAKTIKENNKVLKDFATVGYDYIRKGAKTFKDFAKGMIKEFGEKIRPHLRKIWDSVKETFAKELISLNEKNPIVKPMNIMRDAGLDKAKIAKETEKFRKDQRKKVKGEISELVFQRRANTDVANYESSLFIDGIESQKINGKKISKEQLETIPFIIEGTTVPEKLGRPDLIEIYKTNKRELQPIAREVKEHFDTMWKKIVENTDKLSADQIENYVTHIWDIPKAKIGQVTNWFTTKNKFLNKRYIETLKEGIEKFDLKPKELDITKIIRIHDAIANSVIENAKFVNDLKTIKTKEGKVLMRSDKAPPDWVEVRHPALTTTMYVPGKEGKPSTVVRMPYKVHPDLKQPLDVIFGSRSFEDARMEKVARAWEQVDAVLKKTALSLSLFHHGALIETGIAKMGLMKTGKVLLKETLYRGVKDRYNKNPILAYPKEAKEAMANGVQFGHTLDIDVKGIQKNLNLLAEKTEKIPGLKYGTKLLAKGNEKWDAALWDYLHDPLKLYAFMDAKSKMPKGVNEKTYLRTQGQLINDTFGGQNWENLMVSPKMQRAMRFFLLSPDWTVSTARQALAVTGFGGKESLGRSIRSKEGAKFWLRAGAYFGVGINLLNSYYRKKDIEEHPELYPKDMDFMDYTMFNNSIGHKTHLFTGRYEDGSERYVRWGKQFRELPELFMDEEGFSLFKPALKKLGGKTAPLIQLTSKAFTGRSPSGFEDWNTKDKRGWDHSLGLLKTIGESGLPFSSQNLRRDDKEWTPTDLMMPSSKGMSKSKAISLFKKAIIQTDDSYLKEVYVSAVRNNLDAPGLFNTALTVVKAEETKEILSDVKTIEETKERLSETRNPVEQDKLLNRLNKLEKELDSKRIGFRGLNEAVYTMLERKYNQLLDDMHSQKEGTPEYKEAKEKVDEFKKSDEYKEYFKESKNSNNYFKK